MRWYCSFDFVSRGQDDGCDGDDLGRSNTRGRYWLFGGCRQGVIEEAIIYVREKGVRMGARERSERVANQA